MTQSPTEQLQVMDDLIAGIDVGGPKVQIVYTLGSNIWRNVIPDFPDMYAALDAM